MKKRITSKYLLQILFAFFLALSFQGTGHAQATGTYLSWNNQVGCISYDSQQDPEDPKKRLILIEDIENSPCLRVCEQSTVTYTINGPNISNVQWSVAGGSFVPIISPSNNTVASINWGSFGNGAIDITIFYNDNTQRHITVCVEIIHGPSAKFIVANVEDNATFCLNTEITFQNLSVDNGGSDIVTYLWDFGDGTYSNTFEPTHSYQSSGTHPVKLVVTNSCNCSSVFTMDITIEDKPNIVINCASVVCEGEQKEVYSVSDGCEGQWIVTGGTLAAQTGNEITVIWDQVDDEGFGYVSYRSECTCPFWTTIKIPVVKHAGFIAGDEELCVGDQGFYSLPQWPTTDFTWTLVPFSGSSTTNLVFVDQRNQIVVNALEAGDYMLRCSYWNTLLGCKGEASKIIKIKPVTEVIGSDSFCSGTPNTYHTTTGGIVDWELKKDNNVVTTSSSVDFNYSFPAGGVYTLTATAPGGCTGQGKVISVTQTPAVPNGPIAGNIRICPGTPYDYTVNNNDPSSILVWTVLGGTIQGDNTGNTITVVFDATLPSSGQYTVSVVKRSLDSLGCTSAPLTLNVGKIVVNPTITNPGGLTSFCPSSQTTFTANLNGVIPDLVEWTVEPANFGNIIAGVNSNTVTVNWNEISTSATGVLKLKVKICGTDQYFNTSIVLRPPPVLTFNPVAPICYGGNLNLSLQTSAPVSSGTITWNFGNGSTTTTPINSAGNYIVANPYNNATGSNVNYTITATLNQPNGCNQVVTATRSVVVYPKTTITITPGYNYVVCPSTYSSLTLSANASTGINVSVNYQWYKNNIIIPTNSTSSTYQITGANPGGTYFVRVTDSNSCVVNSQTITVSESCGSVDACTITPNPNVNLTATWSSCGIITASLSYVGTASVAWIGSPFITYSSGNNSGAQFTTNVPGVHIVTAKLTFQTPTGPCVITRNVEVKTHYKPNFNTNVVCNGNGTYNVTLLNNSTIFDVTSANPVTYTFSGTGMTTQTGQTINLTNLAAGTYTYTLTTSMSGKPSCSVTKTITLSALPNPNFNLPQTVYCASEPIYLTIPNYDPVNQYRWIFAGTSYVPSSATSAVNITLPGYQPITLQVTSPYGCVVTSNPVYVQINKATFSGTLIASPSNNVCEGNPLPVISFSSNNPSLAMPISYIWMKGNQQLTSGTSNSFTPTVSGNYWAILVDGNGCRFTNLQPVNVIIRKRPYAGISGPSTLCYGDPGEIKGIVTNNTLQRRWLLNNAATLGVYSTWSNTTPLTLNIPSTNVGTNTYTFEVRPANDAGCGSSASMAVTVYPQVSISTPTFSVVSCEPYKVEVTASGPGTGTYNWTNGDTGQSIFVNYGGALGVTYTETTGCQATATVMIPHPADRSLWIFPEGCYDVCLYTSPAPYILGPLGYFDYYQWIINGQVVSSPISSPTTIPDLIVDQAGAYQLIIHNGICISESGIMNIAPNLKECKTIGCNLEVGFKEGIVYTKEGTYQLEGSIYNPNSYAVNVSLSSFNNYGTYTPNSITIAPYSYYALSPLVFTPNSNFTGGIDFIVIQMQGCMSVYEIKYPTIGELGQIAAERLFMREPVMTLTPNPADAFTTVSYDLGTEYKQAESLTVYNLLGVALMTQKIEKPIGQATLSTLSLPSGTYIVSIQANGTRVLQHTLIKK